MPARLESITRWHWYCNECHIPSQRDWDNPVAANAALTVHNKLAHPPLAESAEIPEVPC